MHHIRNGQTVKAEKLATEWTKLLKVDLELLSEACRELNNKQQYKIVIIILKRLNWTMPHDFWPSEIVKYMEHKGMKQEIFKLLTSRTALSGYVIRMQSNPWVKGKSIEWTRSVNPRGASCLFDHYGKDKEQLSLLFTRYDQELLKRPNDLSLISEYAYWLDYYKQTDKALKLLNSLDLSKIDLLNLMSLGGAWDCRSQDYDKRLVEFTSSCLEHALKRQITNQYAMKYTSGWQMVIPVQLSKRYILERILTELAQR